MKYVLVTGGVVSGLGKGVTASSIGLLLQACGLRVTSIKIGTVLFQVFLASLFCFECACYFSVLLIEYTKQSRYCLVSLLT